MGKAEDTEIGLIAALDQAGTALANLAPILGQYRRALTKEGFTRVEALEIILAFHAITLQKGMNQGEVNHGPDC